MTDNTGTADLVRRLQALEDKEALRTLMTTGWRALDRKDWQTWTDCWSEHAVLEFAPWGTVRGKEAIRAKVTAAESSCAAMQHHLLNMQFEVRGERASGSGYMWFVAVHDEERPDDHYAMGGPYEWEYEKSEDGWRLTVQRLGVSWRAGQDVSGAFAPAEGGVAP
ncbi:nuclear transport factor 2 family protein [Streptomyces sp. NPDC054765]